MITKLLSDKLFNILRDQTGLAFHADIEFTNYPSADYNYYSIQTSTNANPKSVAKVIRACLIKLIAEGFSSEEIAYAKLGLLSDLRNQFINHEIRTEHLGESPQNLAQQISKMKRTRVNELLRTIINPEKLVVIT